MLPARVLCFGELLFRLIPDLKDHAARIYPGGAEANVAAALGTWGVPVEYVSCVPANRIADDVLHELHRCNVNVQKVVRGGDRLGFYYAMPGADLKSSSVVYDRKFSSFSELKPGDINWKELLKDVTWFHWSAITPALSENHAAVCAEAMAEAGRLGITISVDLNYRSLLWKDRDPVSVMTPLVKHCHVVMGNIWSAEKLLGIKTSDIKEGSDDTIYVEAALQSSRQLQKEFSHCNQVAYTFRFNQNEGIRYFSTLFENESMVTSMKFSSARVVERVGTGDSFMAGLIYANVHQLPSQARIDRATRCGFSKFFVEGDFNTTPLTELINL